MRIIWLAMILCVVACTSTPKREVASEPGRGEEAISIKNCVNAGDELTYDHPPIYRLGKDAEEINKRIKVYHDRVSAECPTIRAAIDCNSERDYAKRTHILYFGVSESRGITKSAVEDAAAANLYCLYSKKR